MVTVGGLASGIDTQGVISQLMEIERRPLLSLERDIVELEQVEASFVGLSTRFADLKAAAQGLSVSNLNSPTVSVSDSTVADVSAGSSAIVGSHTLSVTQRATAHRIGSQGFADSDTTPISTSSGNFVVQVGSSGAQVSVAVTTTTTMRDLVSAINAADGDVTASIVSDGTNALSSRMVLSSSKSGASNTVNIITNPTDLNFASNVIEEASSDSSNAGLFTGTITSGGTYTGTTSKTYVMEIVSTGAVGAATYRVSSDGGLTFDDNSGSNYTTTAGSTTLGSNTEGVTVTLASGGTLTAGDRFYIDVSNPTLVTGQDAVFTLDGIQQTRSSNSVTDALPGITLSLLKTGTDISIDVANDDSKISTAIETFVSAYNSLYEAIDSEQNFDPDTLDAGIFLGDRTANTIIRNMRSSLVERVEGTGASVTSLAELGITSSRTGTLSFNASTLSSLLSSDRDGVLAVLGSTEVGSTSTITVSSKPAGAEDGTYGVTITTAPEKAQIQATGAQSDTLTSAETISVDFRRNNSDTSPTTTSFTVSLQSGDTLSQIIDRFNTAFATQNVELSAYSNSGTLAIDSTEYGSDYYVSMVSDVASGSNTSRIGTTAITGTGVDIAGSIQSLTSTGTGSRLEVDSSSSSLDGLAIEYTGSTTGVVGGITLATGASERFATLVDSLFSNSDSVVSTRTESINEQIDQIRGQITRKQEQVSRTQERLEAEFAALEVQLSAIQSQADFLTNQLAQISSIGGRRNDS